MNFRHPKAEAGGVISKSFISPSLITALYKHLYARDTDSMHPTFRKLAKELSETKPLTVTSEIQTSGIQTMRLSW